MIIRACDGAIERNSVIDWRSFLSSRNVYPFYYLSILSQVIARQNTNCTVACNYLFRSIMTESHFTIDERERALDCIILTPTCAELHTMVEENLVDVVLYCVIVLNSTLKWR
jgi:hypothetical protein